MQKYNGIEMDDEGVYYLCADVEPIVMDNIRLRACHAAELGVCHQYCDEVARLKAILQNVLYGKKYDLTC